MTLRNLPKKDKYITRDSFHLLQMVLVTKYNWSLLVITILISPTKHFLGAPIDRGYYVLGGMEQMIMIFAVGGIAISTITSNARLGGFSILACALSFITLPILHHHIFAISVIGFLVLEPMSILAGLFALKEVFLGLKELKAQPTKDKTI